MTTTQQAHVPAGNDAQPHPADCALCGGAARLAADHPYIPEPVIDPATLTICDGCE